MKSENPLRWWMRILGVFYVLLGLSNVPGLSTAGLVAGYPGMETGGVAFAALVDWAFLVGLDAVALGGLLLFASRAPLRYSIIGWAAVLREVLTGVVGDTSYYLRGNGTLDVYLPFMALHLLIIGSGLFLLLPTLRADGVREDV